MTISDLLNIITTDECTTRSYQLANEILERRLIEELHHSPITDASK